MTRTNPSRQDLDLALEALLSLRGREVQVPEDVDAMAEVLAARYAAGVAAGEGREREACAGICDEVAADNAPGESMDEEEKKAALSMPAAPHASGRTAKEWADLLVDNVSTATQLMVEEDASASGRKEFLANAEDWRRNAEALFRLAIERAAHAQPELKP